MCNYVFTVILINFLYTVVNGNITVCLQLTNDENKTEENYLLIVKSLKEGLTTLLEDNSTLFFDHLEFDFHHPAISMKGEVNNLTVSQINEYDFKFFPEFDLAKDEFELFNLTLRNMSTVGEYTMTGNIGDLFDIWGAGHFWANVYNYSISASSKIPVVNSTAICLYLDVKVSLQSEESWFYNLMDDEELEEVINRSFAGLAPDAVEIIWSDIKEFIDGPLEKWLNSIINRNSSLTLNNNIRKTEEMVLDP